MILTRNFISLQVSILNPPGFRKMGIIRQPFKLEKNQGHRWNRDKILQNRGLSGDFFSPFQLLDEWRKISVDEMGRRHKLYIFEIINSGCHLSYNFLHFEINLHLSYIIVNSGCYMLYKIPYLAKSTFICYMYHQIQNSIRLQ